MASTAAATKQAPPRRLAELLEEQQEPFVLEIYLLERGCRRRRSSEFQGHVGCCSTNNNDKFLKRSSTTNKSSGQFSDIVRGLYKKLVAFNQVLMPKNSGLLKERKHGSSGHKARRRNDKDTTMEPGRFSSATSSSTLCNTCSDGQSDVDRESLSSPTNTATHEKDPDRVMTQWRFMDDNKQCSPVSVLDEIDFLTAIPVYNVRQEEVTDPSASRIRLQKKVSEDSTLSASLWELLVQSRTSERTNKPKKSSKPFPFPQYMNSKKALQQTRQLLFDCVREVVDISHSEKQQWRIGRKEKGLMGPEELGKLLCNNLKAWGKLSSDTTNISQLLRTDLILSSVEEWGGSEKWRREISMDIGDGILEEIIYEVLRDMAGQC